MKYKQWRIVSFFQRNENEPLGVVHEHTLSFIILIKNMDYKIKQKFLLLHIPKIL